MSKKPTDGMDWLDFEEWRKREEEKERRRLKNQEYIHKFGGRT